MTHLKKYYNKEKRRKNHEMNRERDAANAKKRYLKNKEKRKLYDKEYNSRPDTKEKRKKYLEEYYSKPENKERKKKYMEEYMSIPAKVVNRRNSVLKRKYGITIEDEKYLYDIQKGRCATCELIFKEYNMAGHNNFEVDHCHKTGKVRGLLCDKCNMALGLFHENIDSIKNILIYLKLDGCK